MLWLFVIIGTAAFSSVTYRLLAELRLRRRIACGQARAPDVAAYLGLPSVEALDRFRGEHPGVLVVVPGLPGPYERVEFTFSSRRIAAHRRRSPLRSIPALALMAACLATAYAAGHATALGWVALVIAFAIELLGWISSAQSGSADVASPSPLRPSQPSHQTARPDDVGEASGPAIEDIEASSTSDDATTLDQAVSTPTDAGPIDDTAAPASGALSTSVLLAAEWRPVPEVFFAALRRNGQRDACLIGTDPDETVRVAAGEIALAVRQAPALPADAFADSSWLDDHDAASDAGDHAARIAVTTQVAPRVPPIEIVRLHARAHAALAEFGPVLAAWWPDAGRLVARDSFHALAETASEVTAIDLCVRARECPPPHPESVACVAYTVGLAALGLPELEVIGQAVDRERARGLLRDAASRLLGGAPATPETLLAIEGFENWRVEFGDASIGPPRTVLRLTRAH